MIEWGSLFVGFALGVFFVFGAKPLTKWIKELINYLRDRE